MQHLHVVGQERLPQSAVHQVCPVDQIAGEGRAAPPLSVLVGGEACGGAEPQIAPRHMSVESIILHLGTMIDTLIPREYQPVSSCYVAAVRHVVSHHPHEARRHIRAADLHKISHFLHMPRKQLHHLGAMTRKFHLAARAFISPGHQGERRVNIIQRHCFINPSFVQMPPLLLASWARQPLRQISTKV